MPLPTPPSDWVKRHVGLLSAGGRVADVACGDGRHARYLAGIGFNVTAIDRDVSGIVDLEGNKRIQIIEADLESGDWPLADLHFDAIVVVNYLYRPRLRDLAASLSPGGVLIYDTFAVGNEGFGRPRNPDYLLRPGELIDAFGTCLAIIAFEQGRTDTPSPAMRQSICAVNRTSGNER